MTSQWNGGFQIIDGNQEQLPVAHVKHVFSDGSLIDETFVCPSRVGNEVFEGWLWSEARKAERDCAPRNHIDKPPLVTDAFGWHEVSRNADGSIRIQKGYDGHSALSWETDETFRDMADYFRHLWRLH